MTVSQCLFEFSFGLLQRVNFIFRFSNLMIGIHEQPLFHCPFDRCFHRHQQNWSFHFQDESKFTQSIAHAIRCIWMRRNIHLSTIAHEIVHWFLHTHSIVESKLWPLPMSWVKQLNNFHLRKSPFIFSSILCNVITMYSFTHNFPGHAMLRPSVRCP